MTGFEVPTLHWNLCLIYPLYLDVFKASSCQIIHDHTHSIPKQFLGKEGLRYHKLFELVWKSCEQNADSLHIFECFPGCSVSLMWKDDDVDFYRLTIESI